MRVLMVHPGVDYSVADVHNGWAEAFDQLGVDVTVSNLHQRLAVYRNAGYLSDDGDFELFFKDPQSVGRMAAIGLESECMRMLPDVVFITSCFFIPPDTLDLLRARGIKVVVLHTEQPYETVRELAVAAHADVNLLNDPAHIDAFRAVGPSVYMPHAYRPTVHHPGPAVADMAADFVFVGTGFPSRIAFLEQVDWTGIDVALGGMWFQLSEDSPLRKFVAHDLGCCMGNDETADAYRSALIGANLYRCEGDASMTAGWAMGPREVEMAASGLFFLRQERGEGDTVLDMLPRFDSPQDFGDKLRFYQARPTAREVIASKAREAIADRTFRNNARALLTLLD